MKVLFFHNRYQQHGGGEEVLVDNEIRLLRAHGDQVQLSTLSNDDIQGPLRILQVAFNLPGSSRSLAWCENEIKNFGPDVVHVHNTFPLITAAVYDACINLKVPVVQSLNNYRMFCANGMFLRDGKSCEKCLNASPYQAIQHACYRNSRLATTAVSRMIDFHSSHKTFDKVNRFVVSNEFTRNKFVSGGIEDSRITVRPPVIMAKPSAKKQKGSYALYVGRMSKEKGVEVLLKSWSGIGLPLKLVGTGPSENALREMAGTDVEFLGRVPDEEVMKCMEEAAFLVIPSLCYENFPMVVNEAYGRSLPILASDLGSLKLLIINEETGLKFKPGDPLSLRDQARRLVANEALLQKVTDGARRYYNERLQPDKIYEQTQNLYVNVIQSYAH